MEKQKYNPDDELVDIVDMNDVVVSSMWRSEASRKGVCYRRIVLAFLVNQEGKLCMLKRTPDKEYLPSHYAIVGGGVQSGETYDQAFKREVQEEVNINVESLSFRPLGLAKPDLDGTIYFRYVYEITVSDNNIQYNPVDFSEYQWVTVDEFLNKLARQEKVAPDLPLMVKRFYSK